MTEIQKQRITYLRGKDESYAAIATALGISENTIKSFCRRNNMGGSLGAAAPKAAAVQVFCGQCGEKLHHTPGKKPLKFCCDDCRIKWWNAHPDKVKKKAVYSFACASCGKPFTAYGNSGRKYCSHSCYIKDRFKGGETV